MDGEIVSRSAPTLQGRTDTEVFVAHCCLASKSAMAHGKPLNDRDIELFFEKGTAIAHCPLSNFFFAGRTLPCKGLLTRGV